MRDHDSLCEFLCYLVLSIALSSFHPTTIFPHNNSLSACTFHSALPKRPREFSPSPKVKVHYVRWGRKETRRGPVLSAQAITPPGSAQTPSRPKNPPGPTQTPRRPKNHTTLRQPRFTQDQTPRSGEAIRDATSLPPIPVPDLLAPKRDRRGKVCKIDTS